MSTITIAMFINAVLYAGIKNPYITKTVEPIMLMVLIMRLPLSVADWIVIEARISTDAIMPIISTSIIIPFFNVLEILSGWDWNKVFRLS